MLRLLFYLFVGNEESETRLLSVVIVHFYNESSVQGRIILYMFCIGC